MLIIEGRTTSDQTPDAELELTFEARSKSRLLCTTTSGEEVHLLLERGQPPLQDGEMLQARDGRLVRVRARPEPLLQVTCASPFELMRAAYHLGNRHVALQLGGSWLRLPPDHVLEQMLLKLGAKVEKIEAIYQPESGAYGGGHHHSHAGGDEFNYDPRVHQFGQPHD